MAQAAYDTAVAEASTEAAAAAANLAAVQEKAKALQEAAEEAKQQFRSLPMHRKQHLRSSLWKRTCRGYLHKLEKRR